MIANAPGNVDLPAFPLVQSFRHGPVQYGCERRVAKEGHSELPAVSMSAEHKIPIITLEQFLGIGVVAEQEVDLGFVWLLRIERAQASFRAA